ncbi:glycosyltransferase family 2 protein [Vibrio breoganii]|uniref:glycosyltransferase family 2 protein n=1 Tax=Vibrio breoganii TaxID=553239 RepID=UPI000C83A503|nr:glycosyltransferase family 2 protein [Vibrio breoganii]PMM44462.1 hypothetical protein BCT52_12075 [Vibrio breoganii]
MQKIDFTVVTVSYNAEETIKQTIDSVLSQKDVIIEYLVIDGASQDNTISILQCVKDERFSYISEPDNGLYDAMNKGIRKAKGKYVAILNSDDVYIDSTVLCNVKNIFEEKESDIVSGHIYYFKDDFRKVGRRYKCSSHHNRKSWELGFQPPHPATFVKKNVYDEIGCYKTNFKISADYEFLLRALYINSYKLNVLEKYVVAMRQGGESTSSISSYKQGNKEVLKAWKVNKKNPPNLLIISKILRKVFGAIKGK